MKVRHKEEYILTLMRSRGVPESVTVTVKWAIRKAENPSAAAEEVGCLLEENPTGKELTRAVQKYIRS